MRKKRISRKSGLQQAYKWVVAVLLLLCTPSATYAQYESDSARNHSRILQVAPQTAEPTTIHPSEVPTGRDLAPSRAQPSSLSLSEHRRAAGDSEAEPVAKNTLAGPAVTVTSSLAVVLGLFALMIYLTRRFGNRTLGHASLPSEVLQSLGTATLDARTKINLLRCGGRVIVLAQTATGVFPISEFTSPEEVRQLIASCQSSSKQSFAQTLQAFEKEPAPAGFVGKEAEASQAGIDKRQRGRLFATA